MSVFFFTSLPGEDPAIQVDHRATQRDLDHRVSLLRSGPVMTTEKNHREIKKGAE
jgi:hypothetical protein